MENRALFVKANFVIFRCCRVAERALLWHTIYSVLLGMKAGRRFRYTVKLTIDMNHKYEMIRKGSWK